MNINGIAGTPRANPYRADNKGKAASSFGRQIHEAAEKRDRTVDTFSSGQAALGMGGLEAPESAAARLAASRLPAPPVEPTTETAPVQEAASVEEAKTYYVEGGPTLIEQLGKFLMDNAAKPDHIPVIMSKENTVCSYGHGIGGIQTVYAEYTADSTPEDPIVRILCQSHSGLYEFTRHINDIDPSNCTYAELQALYGHLRKTGQDYPLYDGLGAVPSGYEIGDMMRRQNFVEGLNNLSQSKMFGPGILADAKGLSGLYALIAEERRGAEDPEFEALLAAVDNIIENKRAMEPKEILERLSESARDTLEDIKNGEEVSRDCWDFFLAELHGMGAISGGEMISAGAHLIPIGYKDENGKFVMYEDVGLYTGLYDRMRATNDGTILAGVTQVDESWTGDPMAFLDAWIESLREWREHLAQTRKENEELKYDDLDPIDRQIEGASSVSALMQSLLSEIEL